VLEYYNRLIGECRTLNGINSVHIAFGNTVTPSEVIQLSETLFVDGAHPSPQLHPAAAFSAEELRRAAREWIEEFRQDLRLVGKREAEPFGRRDLRKSVTLYTDGNNSADKTLVVTLPGANFRIMMPIATLLQNVDATKADVLFIRDGTRSGYLKGLEGLAPAIEEVGPELSRIIDLSAYKRVVGLGVSAGGLPILLVGIQMDFDAVLMCGAGSPMHPRWQGRGRPSPAETLRLAADGLKQMRITVAYGACHEDDRRDAQDIARCIDVEPLEVSLPDWEMRHNILHPLSIRGMLPAFLSRHLGI
jgi:hypothetical protein